MNQDDLIRQIMAEVMKNLGGNDQVTFEKKAAPASSTGTARIGVADYPLAEKSPDLVVTDSGVKLNDLTFEKMKSGAISAADFKISSETLELQAQVADDSGRGPLARNMRRAAELVNVPDERLLAIYNALRPYRSTKPELYGIAEELESKYQCRINAAFIREAADVYEKRGRLKAE